MKKVLALGLILLTIACKSKKITADSPMKFQVENLAQVLKENKLQEIYPEAQIQEGTGVFEEGTVEKPYSILYPGTEDEILIVWDNADKTEIRQIRYEGNGRWRTGTGIAIGTTYDELVALNQGSIDVYGFGWDYSGAVDFKDGKLGKTDVRVFLAPENTPPEGFYGDHVINPEMTEEIKDLDLRVRAITFQPRG